MNRFEFYKELYFQEIDRKKYLNDSLNVPISLISGVIVLIFYCVTNYRFGNITYSDVLFLVLLSVTALSSVKSILYMAKFFAEIKIFTSERSDKIENFKYFPLAGTYEEYRVKNNLTASQYEDAAMATLITCIDHNTMMNDKKTMFLWKAKKTVVVSLVMSLLLMIPFLINFFNEQDNKPTKIEITNPIKVKENE